MYQLFQRFFYRYLGRIIGVGLFTISLYAYRSFENRPVWDRWSYPFFGVVIVTTVVFFIILLNSWRTYDSRIIKYQHKHIARVDRFYLELAILFWGAAYFISAIDNPIHAGRITNLNFFGSTMPVAVILEWISLLLLLIAALVLLSSKLSKKWTNGITMIGMILGCILLVEGIVRFKGITAPTTQGFPSYTSALWERYHVELNSEGFRDVEHAITKDPERRRLLIVGDSFAFGYGIKSIEGRLGSQIGKELTTRTKKRWEVINASRGDTHTLHHIDFLKRSLKYEPDVVILLYVFNDIDYLYPVTPRESQSIFSPSAILFKNFYLYQEVRLRIYHIKYRYFKREGDSIDPYADDSLLALHFQDVSTFLNIARGNGAFVRVVPYNLSVILGDEFRSRYVNFIQAAVASHVPVWSLESVFDNFDYSQLVVNNLDRHPNELANRIAAEDIAKRLITEYYTISNGLGDSGDDR